MMHLLNLLPDFNQLQVQSLQWGNFIIIKVKWAELVKVGGSWTAYTGFYQFNTQDIYFFAVMQKATTPNLIRASLGSSFLLPFS